MIKKHTLGMVIDGLTGKVQRITLRFSADKHNETLTVSTDEMQITMPYDVIEAMVEQARREGRS